jgi:hypothetical protein
VQEGLISVWWALERGKEPSATIITRRMRRYVRRLGKQSLARFYDVESLDAMLDTPHEPAGD